MIISVTPLFLPLQASQSADIERVELLTSHVTVAKSEHAFTLSFHFCLPDETANLMLLVTFTSVQDPAGKAIDAAEVAE